MMTVGLTLHEWRDSLAGVEVEVECGPLHHEAMHGHYLDSYTVLIDGVKRPEIELEGDDLEKLIDILTEVENETRGGSLDI